jgi:hypothetical protein
MSDGGTAMKTGGISHEHAVFPLKSGIPRMKGTDTIEIVPFSACVRHRKNS